MLRLLLRTLLRPLVFDAIRRSARLQAPDTIPVPSVPANAQYFQGQPIMFQDNYVLADF